MKRVIGVVGTIASGKDTVADYIANKLNIQKYEISQTLKDIAHEQDIEITRENLIQLGRTVAAEQGPDFLARILLEKIENTAVISGMRQPTQVEYLKQNSNFILIAIDADPSIRFTRAIERGKAGEAHTLEEFIQNERDENSGSVQRLFDCINMADILLQNNDSIENLERQVDQFLAERGFVGT